MNCLDLCQGFFTDEDTHLVKKFTLYVEDNWNKCDMVAIFLFIVGVTCRSVGPRGLAGAAPGGLGGRRLQDGATQGLRNAACPWHLRCGPGEPLLLPAPAAISPLSPTGCCPRCSRQAARCLPWISWCSHSASSTSLPSISSWVPRSSSWRGW